MKGEFYVFFAFVASGVLWSGNAFFLRDDFSSLHKALKNCNQSKNIMKIKLELPYIRESYVCVWLCILVLQMQVEARLQSIYYSAKLIFLRPPGAVFQTLTCLGMAWFIAWRLRCPFLEEYRRGPRHFWSHWGAKFLRLKKTLWQTLVFVGHQTNTSW